VTHDYIWYLAKGLVFEIRRLLMLSRLKLDGNDLVPDVDLFGNQGNAARAGGHSESVKFECHDKYCCSWGEMMEVAASSLTLYICTFVVFVYLTNDSNRN
jgi:hypothetical protein